MIRNVSTINDNIDDTLPNFTLHQFFHLIDFQYLVVFLIACYLSDGIASLDIRY